MRKLVTLLFLCLTISIVAQDDIISYNGINYWINKDNNEAVVRGFAGERQGVVELPEKVGAYTVTEIYMHAFINCKLLTSITIPGTVREIGGEAFYGCI